MEALARVTDEFRRLDDELSAVVTLPSVDDVIRHAGSTSRASTAAAIAVVAVGALGGVTAAAQIANPPADARFAPAASTGGTVPILPETVAPTTEASPTTEPGTRRETTGRQTTAPSPSPTTTAAPVAPTTSAPVRTTTPAPAPTTSATPTTTRNDEGGPDPSPSPLPTLPSETSTSASSMPTTSDAAESGEDIPVSQAGLLVGAS